VVGVAVKLKDCRLRQVHRELERMLKEMEIGNLLDYINEEDRWGFRYVYLQIDPEDIEDIKVERYGPPVEEVVLRVITKAVEVQVAWRATTALDDLVREARVIVRGE